MGLVLQYLTDLECRNRVRDVGGSESKNVEGSVLYWMWRDKRVQVFYLWKTANKPRTYVAQVSTPRPLEAASVPD